MTCRITILHVNIASNGELEPGSFILSTELKSAAVKKLSKANVSSVSP